MEIDRYKKILPPFFLLALFFIAFQVSGNLNEKSTNFLASVFFQKSVDTQELVQRFEDNNTSKNKKEVEKIKIMIVPGHDNKSSGAQFYSVKEAELNMYVGSALNSFLSKENGVVTFLTRDINGYNPQLLEYFENEKLSIDSFIKEKKDIMNDLVQQGKVDSYINVHHNTARPEVVGVLYGINKYANDNDFDIIIHIHFNDYPGRTGVSGKYNGFSIYVPEKQYSNSEASFDLAEKIKNQLERIFAVSNMPKEFAITEDQELIAIGAFNTSDPISILMEYGYIYERQFTSPGIQETILNELAYQTYLGVMNFLQHKYELGETFVMLDDYEFTEIFLEGAKGEQVLALQNFLNDNDYYPFESNLNDCPINGNFGSCTKKSLVEFQKGNDLEPTGFLDKETIELINNY